MGDADYLLIDDPAASVCNFTALVLELKRELRGG